MSETRTGQGRERGFQIRPKGNHLCMWSLLFIPGTLALLVAILLLSDLAETRVVSPRALILRAVTTRSASPERAEALVVAEAERLLRTQAPNARS